MKTINLDTLDWNKQDGLLPAIIQDANTLQVLMLGYMNREALEATQKENKVTFYSRSKQRLWKKGETSGHVLNVISIEADCDNDTLLIQAVPAGPTCHLNRASCFEAAPENFIAQLDTLLAQRQKTMPEGSYTTKLFESGVRRIAQKVGEEGVETALAAVAQDE
ncbi:MAG: bifunctional phosphoribosyl-AMP cyclohydrolase/phosphoribosyl-ATP diphosphatase HisIE, partial [Methylococcales bacterium]